MQRLLSRAAWDAAADIRAVRRFAVAGLDQAARGGRRGLAVGARAAGCRWPVEEDFRSGKGCFGLDESQVRLFTAIARHTALVMAALAICAVTAALLRRRTDTRAPAPVRPDQPPPADPGLIPLTVPETARLLAHPPPPGASRHWLAWRRRHHALSAWYHQRTGLARDEHVLLVS